MTTAIAETDSDTKQAPPESGDEPPAAVPESWETIQEWGLLGLDVRDLAGRARMLANNMRDSNATSVIPAAAIEEYLARAIPRDIAEGGGDVGALNAGLVAWFGAIAARVVEERSARLEAARDALRARREDERIQAERQAGAEARRVAEAERWRAHEAEHDAFLRWKGERRRAEGY